MGQPQKKQRSYYREKVGRLGVFASLRRFRFPDFPVVAGADAAISGFSQMKSIHFPEFPDFPVQKVISLFLAFFSRNAAEVGKRRAV